MEHSATLPVSTLFSGTIHALPRLIDQRPPKERAAIRRAIETLRSSLPQAEKVLAEAPEAHGAMQPRLAAGPCPLRRVRSRRPGLRSRLQPQPWQTPIRGRSRRVDGPRCRFVRTMLEAQGDLVNMPVRYGPHDTGVLAVGMERA